MLGPFGQLPLSEWIVLPVVALVLGMLTYGLRVDRPVLVLWAAGATFFGLRFLIESGTELGRPDRVFAALVLWTVFSAFIALGRKVIEKRFNPL